jgi:hypothetical protein
MELVFFFLILIFDIRYVWNWISYIFYLLCMNLSWSRDLNHEFNRLIWVDLGYFWTVFIIDFFLFHHSTTGWLKIKLYNVFQFVFYKVILISLFESRVWQVDPNWLYFSIIFLIGFSIFSRIRELSQSREYSFFFRFQLLKLDLLVIELRGIFYFIFYEAILVLLTNLRG